jgi:alpha-tubulin suppressor-like RCC1 family protein
MSYSTDWALVSSGGYYSGGIKTDGSLWTWGRANSGRLGHNSFFADRSSPGTISGAGTTWQKLSCGDDFGAAIKTDGTLWTWGGNLYGQLGDGTGTSRSSPETVAGGGTTWDQVAVGFGGLSGIKTDGTLWVWGYNATGRVGDGTTTSRSSPVTTAGGGTNWAKIANSWGGSNHAIKTDGTLWTWGTNSDGELGTGNATTRSSPGTAIGNLLWTSVAGATSSKIGLSDPDTTYSNG